MSRTSLIWFKGGVAHDETEYANSWGGAALVWNGLFERYMHDPAKPFVSWISLRDVEANKFWGLAADPKLKPHERAVFAFTFDRFYVKRENFRRIAADMRAFLADYQPSPNVSNHLSAWADAIEASEAEAVGLYATSVGENLWVVYDQEKDVEVPTPLSAGTEVYEWLEGDR